MIYTCYFDGYSSPKLHRRAGYCYVIASGENGDIIAETIVAMDPFTTNNVAEAEGLINLLKHLIDIGICRTTINPRTCNVDHSKALIMGDSLLVVNMFNKKVRLKNPLLKIYQQKITNLKKVLNRFVEVSWVPRKENQAGLLISKRKI